MHTYLISGANCIKINKIKVDVTQSEQYIIVCERRLCNACMIVDSRLLSLDNTMGSVMERSSNKAEPLFDNFFSALPGPIFCSWLVRPKLQNRRKPQSSMPSDLEMEEAL